MWSLHLYLNITKKRWFEALRLQVVFKSSLKEPDLEMFKNIFNSHLMDLHEISLRLFLKEHTGYHSKFHPSFLNSNWIHDFIFTEQIALN